MRAMGMKYIVILSWLIYEWGDISLWNVQGPMLLSASGQSLMVAMGGT